MKFLVSVLLLVLCFCTVAGDPPPGWPPPSYVMARQWQNIMDYGAKGDGTTDDRAAIQAALDAVGDSGGTVFVPHSDSGFLIKNTLRIPSYVRLLGVGRGSIIRMDADSSRCILANADTLNGDTDIVVERLYFNGYKTYTLFSDRDSADCISFINVHRSSVQNCWVTRTDCDGIAFRRSTDCKILNNTLWELGEDGITVAGLGSGSNIVSGNHIAGRDTSYEVGGLIPSGILCKSSEAIITDNVIVDCGAAIDINNESGDTLRDITVTGNLFLNCWQTTVSIADGVRLIVAENTFYDCASEGVYTWASDPVSHDINISNNTFYSQGGIAIRAVSGYNYVISGNIIVASDTVAIICASDGSVITGNRITEVAAGYGIHLTAQRNSIVSNNQVSYVDKSGIYCELFSTAHEYLSITGNSVVDCGEYGIDVLSLGFSNVSNNVCVGNALGGIHLSNSDYNVVSDNVCRNSPDSTQAYGILLESSSNKNIIHSNMLGGNVTAAISGGSDNAKYGNSVDTTGVAIFTVDDSIKIGNYWQSGAIGTDGWVLTTNGAGWARWIAAPGGGADADSIRGKPVSQAAPTDNYILIYNSGLDSIMWEVETGGAGEANTISDTGTYNDTEGFGLAGGKTGVSLKVKGLIEGSNITITKSGDSALTFAASGGSGFWAFRDSTTIVYVNDSTGDTNVFIQDTTGFRGLRVSGIIADTLTINNWIEVPSLYGDEVGSYKIRMFDTVAFKRRPYYSGVTMVCDADSVFITMEHVKKIAGDSAAGETNTLGDTGTFNGTEGFGLAGGKTGTVLKVKGLIEGSNITIAASGDSGYTITGSAGGSAVEILESNVSKDDPLVILNFMSGFDITVVNDTSYVTFDFTEDKVNLTPGAETEVTGVLSVENGGTETNTLTDGGILLGSGTGAITALGEAANGQIPIGDGTTDPVLNEIDGTANEVTVTNSAGTITLSLPNHAGTDISVDLEEETHASEHEDTGGDEIAVTAGMMNTGTGASSSTYWRGDNSWATPGGAAWNWTDSTGFLVGWGGVAKSVVNDTNYFRFEGGSDFDTTGGSVSLADDAVDPVVLKDSNVQAQGDIVTIAASSQFGFKTVAELALMEDEDVNTFSELQSWVSDKTLMNEEDIFTIDANWVNTANPWADNEIATSGNWNTAYGWGDHSAAGYLSSLNELFAYFDRTYFDTLADASGDSITIAVTTSANWLSRVSDPTGTGAWVFGTSPTFTTSIIMGDATLSEAELEILDGATPTTTEFNYVTGVTSAIQTQLDGKFALSDFDNSTIDTSAGGALQVKDGGITDAKVDSLDPDKLEQDGATSGQNLQWSGTAWVPTSPGQVQNLFINGTMQETGEPATFNHRHSLDTTRVYASNASTYEALPTPVACTLSDGSDPYAACHPGILYTPMGLLGTQFQEFITYTYCGDECEEDILLAVRQLGDSWQEFVDTAGDTLHNPVWSASDFGASHLSDPDIFFTANGRLGIVFRATYAIPSPDTHNIIVTTTADGITWDSTRILSAAILGLDSATLMSPSIILDTNATYKIWAVEANGYGGGDENTVIICEAPEYDSGWTLVDTTDMAPFFPALGDIWHIDVLPNGPDELICIIYLCDEDAGGSGSTRGDLYLAISIDGGMSWTTKNAPFLTDAASGWDGTYLYRSTGYWLERGNRSDLALYYSAKQTAWDANDSSWHTGYTIVHFGDTNYWKHSDTGYYLASRDWAIEAIDTTTTLDSTNFITDGQSLDNINWQYEWIYLTGVPTVGRALTDSIYLHSPMRSGDTTYLLRDSAGDITPSDDDTVLVTGYVPYACTIDSLEIMYQVSSGSEIEDVYFKGPDLSAPSNLTDSTYWSSATDLTSTAWDTAQYTFTNDVSASAGDRFALKYIMNFDADNDRLRIGWIRIRVQR